MHKISILGEESDIKEILWFFFADLDILASLSFKQESLFNLSSVFEILKRSH